jgi:hypothetical protein
VGLDIANTVLGWRGQYWVSGTGHWPAPRHASA